MVTHRTLLGFLVSSALSCSPGSSRQGSRLAVAVADTSRPKVPPLPNLPSDSAFTVEGPGHPRSELLYYRNIVGLVFHDTTSGQTIRDLLERYSASIIGGVPGPAGPPTYIIQIPDPGPTFGAVDSVVARLGAETGVVRASMVHYRTPIRLKNR